MSHRGPFLTKPGPGVQVDWTHPLSRGLMGSWLYNALGGTRIDNLVAGKYGTLTNGAAWSGSPHGSGVTFDGTDDFVTAGTTTDFDPLALTIIVWLRIASLVPTYSAIVSKIAGGAGGHYQLFVKSTGQLACYIRGITTDRFYDGTGTYTLTVGPWYCLCLTYSNNIGLRGFVNGNLDGTAASGGVLATNAGILNFGRDTATAGRLLTGVVSKVDIYNRDFSDQEVKQTFSAPFANLLAPRRLVPVGVAVAATLSRRRSRLGVGR